ncbi:MAG: hypothetical protein KDD89_08675, partial [Anaerolineales bacterium]|nr:hypothetical protein [Anaerolineales bacterium]
VDCVATLDYGTVITLTAVAETGSTFTGWDGACSGTGDCVVTITDTTNVTATFDLNQYDLTVALDGTGNGSVTSDPAGIDCGVDCVATLDYGTVITLTAVAGTNGKFTGWGGACAGTNGSVCTVTITADTAVTATFVNEYVMYWPIMLKQK